MLFNRTTNKTTKFNFELNKSFDRNILNIQKHDIKNSLQAIFSLCEYIKFCCFKNYQFKNKHLLTKYCRLLRQFEKSNQPILIKACKEGCIDILKSAIKSPITIDTIHLCLEMNQSNYESIRDLSEDLMMYANGTFIRGVSF